MKLPNGYGTVYKLSGNRRRPFIARRTVEWTEDGKQILITIGYYDKRETALQALADYNNDPYDLVMSKKTFADMYHQWYKETFNDDSNRSTTKNYVTAFANCASLHNMAMSSIRLMHMQKIIDQFPDHQAAGRIRTLLNKLFEWSKRHEYVTKNRAEELTIPKYEAKSERTAFTKEHLKVLWDLADSHPNVPFVLMLTYSGVRINELLSLLKADVNLDEQWFRIRDSKTQAGIRIVPIADKVLPYWKNYMEKSKCKYAVCTTTGEELTYSNYHKHYWTPLMESLNINYTPHETRHTCNSLLIMANVNPTMRKKIMGHKSQMDIGELVYGHIYTEELVKAINMI